ncbi:MAG: hypothetical protein KC492_34710, partial [Myxococcales bacterium]|nr:hypothetical protein [Myxococcales bacterium]
ARSMVRVAKQAIDRDGLTHSEPIVHVAIRLEREGEANRLLLREAQLGRLRVCDSRGIETPADDLIEAAACDGETRFKPLDDRAREAIQAGSREVDPGNGLSRYDGPPIELELDPEATKLAALYTTPGWLDAWGKDRGLDFSVEFSGVVFPTANGWGGMPLPSEAQPGPPATGLGQAESLQAPQSDLSDASKTSKGQAIPRTQSYRMGRDLIAPIVGKACSAVPDPFDTAAVFAELERLARLPDKERPSPLTGVDSGGVSWMDGGVKKKLTRRNLGQRLNRRKRQHEGR